MKITTPDRAAFIAAAKNVQQAFGAEKGPLFTEMVNKIQAAAR